MTVLRCPSPIAHRPMPVAVTSMSVGHLLNKDASSKRRINVKLSYLTAKECERIMKKIALSLSLILIVCTLASCEQRSKLVVEGFAEFSEGVIKEYPCVESLDCILHNPSTFSIKCVLNDYVIPEKIPGLIEQLKDYAITDALDAYNESIDFGARLIFVEFNVRGKVFFRYRYLLSGYEAPVWELE